MNYTETQQNLLNELAAEFGRINAEFDKKKGNFNLFDPTPIIHTEIENVRQVKELKAHNDAMSEQAQQMFRDIRDMLNEDLKDISMRCIENINSGRITALKISPIDKQGNPIYLDVKSSLIIYIDFETENVGIGTKSYHKNTGFRFGSHDNYFDTIEGFTNCDYFKRKFGEIYNGYCIPR